MSVIPRILTRRVLSHSPSILSFTYQIHHQVGSYWNLYIGAAFNPTSDSEYFEVDVTQSPRPKGGIVREGDEVQDDVILNFNSCQRKMCFDVSLKDGSSRPPLGHYDITLLVVRAPNHSIITALDQERASGFIEIR